jgi:uncharacterized membrane protein YfcA
MEVAPQIIVALSLVCVCSGFIDAIAGGGGLLTVPAMLFAGIPPLNMLATNKLQSTLGVSTACYNYARSGLIDWKPNRLSVLLVLAGAAVGALVVQAIDTAILGLLVPIMLVLVAIYVLVSPRMSDEAAHHRISPHGYAPIAGGIGFYDGFFGPGAGTFFTTSLVALRGHGLTRAAALSKLFNLASNAASLAIFIFGGKVLWVLGLSMAIGSMTGAYIGTHTALKFGARIIRPLLVIMSLGLTGRLIWGYFAV